MQNRFYKNYGKRIFDLLLSMVIILFLVPVFLLISLAVIIFDKGPIFFIQERIGKDFNKFNIIKFRTMVPNADKIGPSITGKYDQRITFIGKFLRKSKLDELPQFINVIRNDISIVGPRPEVEKYVQLFKNEYMTILQEKPGITDFASLYFRDEEEELAKYKNVYEGYVKDILPRKIEFYKKYIEQISFSTDLKVIIKTIWSIFK